MHLGLKEVNEGESNNKNIKSKNSPWEHVQDETFYWGPCRKEHRGSHGLNSYSLWLAFLKLLDNASASAQLKNEYIRES